MGRPRSHQYQQPELGKALAWMRNQAGVSQTTLSSQLKNETNSTYLSHIERGKVNPGYTKLLELLAAFGNDEQDLVRLLHDKPWEANDSTLRQAYTSSFYVDKLSRSNAYDADTLLGASFQSLASPPPSSDPFPPANFSEHAVHAFEPPTVPEELSERPPLPAPQMLSEEAALPSEDTALPSEDTALPSAASGMRMKKSAPKGVARLMHRRSAAPMAQAMDSMPAAAAPAPVDPELLEIQTAWSSLSRAQQLTLLGLVRNKG